MSDLRQVINERNKRGGRLDPANLDTIRRTVSRQGCVEVRVEARSVDRSRSPRSRSRDDERRNSSEWRFSRRGSSDRGRTRTSTSPAGKRPNWRPASPLPYQLGSKNAGKNVGEENYTGVGERDKVLGSSKEALPKDVLDTTDLDAISDEELSSERNPNTVEQDFEVVSDGSVAGAEAEVGGEYDVVSDAELKDTSGAKDDSEVLDQISASELVSKNAKQEEDNVSLGSLESVGVDGQHPLQTSDISADEGDVVGAPHPPVKPYSTRVPQVDVGESVRWFDSPEQARRHDQRDNPQDHHRVSAASRASSSSHREFRDRHEERHGERRHRDDREGRGECRRAEKRRYGGHHGRDDDHGDYSFSRRSPPRRKSEGSRSPDGYSRSRREAPRRPNPPDPGSRTKVVQNPETMGVKKVKPCLICQGTDHMAKECKDLKCYRCNQMGHFAKECPNPATPRTDVPQADVQQQRQANRPERQVQCYNCEEYGHNIKQCQYLTCRKCGGQGHFAKECTNPPRMSMIMNSASIAPPSYSIDYGHTSSSAGPQQYGQPRPRPQAQPSHLPPPPSFNLNEEVGYSPREGAASSVSRAPSRRPGSLLEHFVLRLRERGASGTDVAMMAKEMMMTWRKAGYAEESLRALHDRGVSSAGGGVSALRLALVGALDRLSGSQIPLSVNVSRLLDDTLDYLVLAPPSDTQRAPPAPPSLNIFGQRSPPPSGPPVPPSMSLLGYSSAPAEFRSGMNRFQDLVAGIRDGSTTSREGLDGRMRSLEHFRVYLAAKIYSKKDLLGVAEEHIGEMSSGVQTLLAHVGYEEFTLRRMFNAYGREAAESAFGERLTAYSGSLPAGISIRFIVETTCHFLASLEGGR